MMQSQPQTTSLFRTSLRDWQARFKARQATQDVPVATPEHPPAREKRLVARKRRKMNQAASEATE